MNSDVLPVPRWRVLRSRVDGFTVDSFCSVILEAVEAKRQVLFLNHNVNSLALFERNDGFRALYSKASYIFIDGMPVVWLAKLAGFPATSRNRTAVLDWFWQVCAEAERKSLRIVHIGSRGRVLRVASERISRQHPNIDISFVDGFFDINDERENSAVLAAVSDAAPDILLVGMGMPRQEQWIAKNLEKLPECVITTVGGIIGYIGGERPTCPRWLGAIGFEWLYRLATEPLRLWRRYLVEPVTLAPLVIRELQRRIVG